MSRIFSYLFLSAFLISFAINVTGCSEDDRFRERDFSASPDPVDISGIVPDTVLNGILIYNVRTGNTNFGAVTQRDIANMRFTFWEQNGEGRIRDSSYEDGREDPIAVNIQNRTGGGFQIVTGSYFPRVVAGMYEGGFRSVKIPPSVTNRPDTLRYDLELMKIFD